MWGGYPLLGYGMQYFEIMTFLPRYAKASHTPLTTIQNSYVIFFPLFSMFTVMLDRQEKNKRVHDIFSGI